MLDKRSLLLKFGVLFMCSVICHVVISVSRPAQSAFTTAGLRRALKIGCIMWLEIATSVVGRFARPTMIEVFIGSKVSSI